MRLGRTSWQGSRTRSGGRALRRTRRPRRRAVPAAAGAVTPGRRVRLGRCVRWERRVSPACAADARCIGLPRCVPEQWAAGRPSPRAGAVTEGEAAAACRRPVPPREARSGLKLSESRPPLSESRPPVAFSSKVPSAVLSVAQPTAVRAARCTSFPCRPSRTPGRSRSHPSKSRTRGRPAAAAAWAPACQSWMVGVRKPTS